MRAPAGTYLHRGASAPIADPGGTYSHAGATAPTTDPAGTYSSPYALDRLFIEDRNDTPANGVLAFSNETEVANYYGASSREAHLADQFFDWGKYDGIATMLFTRLDNTRRPHLLGVNLTGTNYQAIRGTLELTYDSYLYTADVDLSAATSFLGAAQLLQTELNKHRKRTATTTGSSIEPHSVSFTGSVHGALLTVTNAAPGTIQLGGEVATYKDSQNQIVKQLSGAPGGSGTYGLFANGGSVDGPPITETYGILTVGHVTSGSLDVGQEVEGVGVQHTAIDEHLGGGTGAGSTWLVNVAQSVSSRTIVTQAPPLSVVLNWNNIPIHGRTTDNNFLDISVNPFYGFNVNLSYLSFGSGTAADALGLTQAVGAQDSSPGGLHLTVAQSLDNLVNAGIHFGSYQNLLDKGAGLNYQNQLAAWALSPTGLHGDGTGHQWMSEIYSAAPAGASAPVTDPAGTWSGRGASYPSGSAHALGQFYAGGPHFYY